MGLDRWFGCLVCCRGDTGPGWAVVKKDVRTSLNVKTRRRRKPCVPDKFISQEAAVYCQGLQDVVADLSEELTVLCKGLWVRVAAFVRAELQQNCRDGGEREIYDNRKREMSVKCLETVSDQNYNYLKSFFHGCIFQMYLLRYCHSSCHRALKWLPLRIIVLWKDNISSPLLQPQQQDKIGMRLHHQPFWFDLIKLMFPYTKLSAHTQHTHLHMLSKKIPALPLWV